MDTAGGSCDQIQYIAMCACLCVYACVCVWEGDMMAWQRLNITFDRHQMPAGTGRKGIEGNGLNNSCYSFLSQHRRSLALGRHTGPDSCRFMWTCSHTNSRK